MREGRCVSGNYGHIGCSIDVRAQLDRWCSGRPSCEIPVTALVRGAKKPCPKDFRSFLEATYTCVQVMTVDKEECPSASFVEVTTSEGYISSRTTEESGCGSIDTPWLLKTKPGQRVNISLWDFDIINRKQTGLSATNSGMPPPCHVYAIIKERSVTSSKTVCPNDAREAHVFTSLGNVVEIRIVTKKQEDDDHGYFLLHFQSIGCADVAAPLGGYVKRIGDRALLGCDATDEEWRLACHKDSWIGTVGNCTKLPNAAGVSGRIWNVMSSSQGISIAIIIGVAVLVGILILVSGLVCLKWQRAKRPHNMNTFSQVTCYSPDDPRGYNSASTLEKHRSSSMGDPYSSAENNYYRTWQLQQRSSNKGTIQGTELPPPPYHPVSVSSERDYDEHVYESPKFDRRDIGGGGGGSEFIGGELTHAQYYELDPEVLEQNGGHMSQQGPPHIATLGRGNNRAHGSGEPTSRMDVGALSWKPHHEELEVVESCPGVLVGPRC